MSKSKKNKHQPTQPKFDYISDCCGTIADKEPCIRQLEDVKDNKWSQSSLGKWHCVTCKKHCTVTRRHKVHKIENNS